ncbi:hypothetical protein PCC8801_2589 [Rippkaea orientalis PCC 8801]|uniref:Low temperature-induced protein n=1 Tax=Rippkaea orientalis (strain PCC 8801 / RF-1) TaxID=41431 RepID=B7K4T8_RIPO1|nr:hypothetical protein [Rippkaea orientalis]ACK66594.1 hypothetical protein PCC8801_2589 [Rippkaea orientalis PCC 8801]
MMSIKVAFKKLALVALVFGTITGFSSVTVAQSLNRIDQDPYQKNEQNPEGEFGNIFSPIDMMHNSNLQRSRNSSDFAEDTTNNLNKAAEEFKRIQQQRLEQDSSNSSSEPTSLN